MSSSLLITSDGTSDDKLIVTSDGRLIVGDPPTRCWKLAIIVYNSNCVTDDNFDVRLNGTSLGTIDNLVDPAIGNQCTGRIFAETTAITRASASNAVGGPIACPCAGNNFQSTLALDMGLLVAGDNRLRIVTTQDNGSGNLGTVWVGGLMFDGLYYPKCRTLLESFYGGFGPVGIAVFDQTFKWCG